MKLTRSTFCILFLMISCATTKQEKKKVVVKKPSENIKVQAQQTAMSGDCNQISKTSTSTAAQGVQHLEKRNTWLDSAKCFKMKGDMNKALFYFKLGLSKDPNNEDILSELTEYHLKTQNYAKAYDLLKNMKRMTKEENLKRLGVLENYFGHYQNSIRVLSKIPQVSQDKNYDQVNYLQAVNYIALGDYRKAYVNFEKVSEKYKHSPSKRVRYLYTLVKVDDLAKAKKLISDRNIASNTVDPQWVKLANLVNAKLAAKSQVKATTKKVNSVTAPSSRKE